MANSAETHGLGNAKTMSRLVSSDFYNILSRISDRDLEPEHILRLFREMLPEVTPKYGIVLMRACVYEPIKRSADMKMTEIELYDATGGTGANTIELEYPIETGGRVVVTAGIRKDTEWTEEMREDNYVISRMVYLIVGRAKTMAMLNHLTFFDQMTGISNETGLNKFMGMTLAQGRFAEYCSNFLNIKNMKLINSRYGDKTGDLLMIEYARAIDAFAKEQGNGVAARLGGDNFLIFIEKRSEDAFLDYVKSLPVSVTKGNGEREEVRMEARLGYYYIQPGDVIGDAMRSADVAARLARKSDYPDLLKFEKNMMTHILKMRQLEQSIPQAIANREFVVYYQPKADISLAGEYRLNGAEALIRWKKDGEMIPPGEFIPLLEKCGLIALIDYYVLEQICIDINDWISRGLQPVKVSSNFSRRHLQDKEFADKVEAIIRKHNVDPRYIEIEITESYDDEDLQALKTFEERMHNLGVDLSVDDFGSGFSSIKMIKYIVADTIKLDKSIIDGIGDDNADDIIISHIIMMINKLGKKVIAEGVETEKQAAFLRENGCTNIQGFLFARPCAKEDYEKYM